LDEIGWWMMRQEAAMVHTLLGVISLLILTAFIWFAFRQGFYVKPERNNRDDPGKYGLGPWNDP
jgi:hypothetical protein